jgi:Tol biopolymer transport system component
MGFRSSCHLRWSPDALHLLCGGREPDGPRALYSVDVQTGAATVLRTFEDGGITIWYDWAPDGKTIYYKADYGNESRIVHLDPATGAEQVLRAVQPPYWISIYLAVSPDGGQLAFWEMDDEANKARLLIMPTADAPATKVREISSTDGQGRRYPPTNPLRWSRDGRYLLHWTPEGDSDSPLVRLWRIPVSGGAAERTDLTLRAPLTDIHLSPDGRRVVFESGHRGLEIWVMKNYLPHN